jgi:hypothetical protein
VADGVPISCRARNRHCRSIRWRYDKQARLREPEINAKVSIQVNKSIEQRY